MSACGSGYYPFTKSDRLSGSPSSDSLQRNPTLACQTLGHQRQSGSRPIATQKSGTPVDRYQLL